MRDVELDAIDLALIRAADALRAADANREQAWKQAQDAALAALKAGVSELAVAKALGVNRLTVRKWAGKT